MRSLQSTSSLRGKLGSTATAIVHHRPRTALSLQHVAKNINQQRWFARPADNVQHDLSKAVWFRNGPVALGPENAGHFFDHKPVDQRKLKLGNTIRTLRDRLPTLLAAPLPQELLSPQITLRLFPSTHPHLPKVTGRIAYTAALWTSPVAWGRVPVVGNVKLVILSERMVSTGFSAPSAQSVGGEKLIVRWKTCGGAGTGDVTDQIKKMMAILGRSNSSNVGNTQSGEDKNKDFHGLFLFEFDDEGRISSHTIEHVEEGNNWERTAKVISVTDWLLARGWAKKEEGQPAIAFCPHDDLRDHRLRRS